MTVVALKVLDVFVYFPTPLFNRRPVKL